MPLDTRATMQHYLLILSFLRVLRIDAQSPAIVSGFLLPVGKRMKPSTAWSLLAFAMALASYALHRDISANVFLGCVFIIQGLKRPDGSAQERRATFLAAALSAGILLFALWALATGLDLRGPAPFRYKH